MLVLQLTLRWQAIWLTGLVSGIVWLQLKPLSTSICMSSGNWLIRIIDKASKQVDCTWFTYVKSCTWFVFVKGRWTQHMNTPVPSTRGLKTAIYVLCVIVPPCVSSRFPSIRGILRTWNGREETRGRMLSVNNLATE